MAAAWLRMWADLCVRVGIAGLITRLCTTRAGLPRVGLIGVRAGGERAQLHVRIVVRLHHCVYNCLLKRAVVQVTVPVGRYCLGINIRGAWHVRFAVPDGSVGLWGSALGARGFPCWVRSQRVDIHVVGLCCCRTARVVS
jgi:hypothetical protein